MTEMTPDIQKMLDAMVKESRAAAKAALHRARKAYSQPPLPYDELARKMNSPDFERMGSLMVDEFGPDPDNIHLDMKSLQPGGARARFEYDTEGGPQRRIRINKHTTLGGDDFVGSMSHELGHAQDYNRGQRTGDTKGWKTTSPVGDIRRREWKAQANAERMLRQLGLAEGSDELRRMKDIIKLPRDEMVRALQHSVKSFGPNYSRLLQFIYRLANGLQFGSAPVRGISKAVQLTGKLF